MSTQKTKAQHTPGPWDVQQYKSHIGFSVWALGRGCIAERWYDKEQQPPYGDEIEANANLIAAAPELLKAIQRLVSDHDDGLSFGIAWADARAAIAKATGGAQ